jgi:N-succinyldiaminopimelate aminotransferase
MIAADREMSPSVARAAQARSPFVRLTELLTGSQPGKSVINLSVGEPQHPVPDFVGPVIAKHIPELGRYPMTAGTERFRQAVAKWLGWRFRLARPLDPKTEVLVLAGTREGLFLAALTAKYLFDKPNGAILIPNPFYAVYAAGAKAAGCETVFLPATQKSGFLPDLDALGEDLLKRTVAIYLASPANPQGAVADAAYQARLVGLARRHGFMIFADECYSEIYSDKKPAGVLEAAGPNFENVAIFHSLSKRSSLPGLRIGFTAGDARFIGPYLELRNIGAPQVPIAAQEVAVAAYGDEAHVEENRRLYSAKFDLADQIIGDRYGYKRPAGGFFLWLDVSQHGGSEGATLKLWREAGVRVVPGNYLAHKQSDGSNPGEGYIRVALVQDKATTAEALHRLVGVLG